jgi:hypothetical protein
MRQTWIFQANPNRFDIDGFLNTKPGTCLWSVTRSADQMRLGDQVFIWRAIAGDDPKKSGVVAQAEIIGAPQKQGEGEDALPFWRQSKVASDDSELPQLRCRLRLLRIAGSDNMLRRAWLGEDPVLSDLTVLRSGVGTNFSVPEIHAARLNALWSRIGEDWNYPESVAGLWTYVKTYGGQVSRLPGSPVVTTALRIGRVVSGVYNKVMNFRSLDPRDSRKGLSGARTAAACDRSTDRRRQIRSSAADPVCR